MEYKASFDTLTKGLTLGIIILFSVIGQKNIRGILTAEGDTVTILIHTGVLLFLITTIVVSYGYSTQNYQIEANELIINRPFGNIIIPIADITEVRKVEEGEMKGTLRTFGSGGLFGYYGKFYNKTFRSMTLYTTQQINRVYIKTKNGNNIIISPDDLSLLDNIKSSL